MNMGEKGTLDQVSQNINVYALKFKSVDLVGGSKNLDIIVSVVVNLDVVIELRLRDDDSVFESCLVAILPYISDCVHCCNCV